MASDPPADSTAPADAETVPPPRRRGPRWRHVLAAVLLLFLVALPAFLWWLSETEGGRGFAARQASTFTLENGLRVEIGRIDGSLLRDATLRDVTLHDLDGAFGFAPEVGLRWRPGALVRRHLVIDRLRVPELRISRMWNLERDPDSPLLPDFDIRIDRFEVNRLELAEEVAGRLDVVSLTGSADIRDGRLLLDVAGEAEAGDRLLLRIDAEPDGDRFDLAGRLLAPDEGLVLRLIGLDTPLDIRATGVGSWSNWRGQLIADAGPSGSTARLAQFDVSARAGRFSAVGSVNPAPILGEVPEALEPAIRIEATARREGDTVLARGFASTDALAFAGGGGVDLRSNRFLDTSGELRVLRPQAISADLRAQDLRAGIRLSGPTARPEIGWDASAASIAFVGEGDPIGLTGLIVRGGVRPGARGEPVAVPFEAAAARVTGLAPQLQQLLATPRARGTVLVSETRIFTPDLRLASAGLTASVDASSSRATGVWLANVEATVPRLRLDGIGTAAVTLVTRVEPGPRGSPVAAGRATARALVLESAPAADFLGGLPTARTAFVLGPDGVVRFADAGLDSPNLTLANGEGSFDPASGQFRFAATGRSRTYGPLTISASGTADAPTATLTMPEPGFGVGLTEFTARVEPAAGNNLLVTATGTSPGGPLDARLMLLIAGDRPLGVEVERIDFAGVSARGSLVQTPAGPFAGALLVSGQGLDGAVNFAAAGPGATVQRVSGEVTAINARVPLDPPVVVSKGNARFTALLFPGAPQVAGDMNASGVRRDTLVLTSIRAQGRLRDGTGAVTASINGRIARRDPFAFRLAAQTIEPGFAMSLEGNVGSLPLKLTRPAQFHRRPGGYELLPVRLDLPKGTLELAGAWGDTAFAAVAARAVDLGVVESLVPGLRLAGVVNGQARFDLPDGAPLPVGSGSFRVEGLVRTDSAALIPVDLSLALRGTAEGLEAGARMTNNGKELGRVLARVAPTAGDTLGDRLQRGPISGGIRFNGPVEALWALAAIEGQELTGPVAIAADLRGTLRNPDLVGLAQGSGLLYRNIPLGTVIDDLGFEGRFRGPNLEIVRAAGNARGGTVTASGRIGFGQQEGETINLRAELSKARLAATDLADVTLTGPLSWRGTSDRSRLSGRLVVDSGRFVVQQLEASDVPQLQVRRADEQQIEPERPMFATSGVALDIAISSGPVIEIEGMGLDSRWRGNVRVSGTAADPRLVGTATLVEGSYSFAGNDFDIGRGVITFNGAPLDSSLLIEASTTTSDGVTANIILTGTAARPEIAFSSSPALPDDEILARLLFGASVADLSLPEAIQLASAVATLQGGGSGGLDPIGRARRAAGIDRLRIVGDGITPGMGTTLVVGQRLSRNVYIEVQTDTEGNVVTLIKLALTSALDLLAQVSSVTDNNSINLRYQRDR
jgi:translocation and assembly module TamB